MNRQEEVRFDRMVPSQVVRRRRALPVAYLPVGALEWHGAHMPLGTDCLTVTHIAERAAQEIGGVAFPPVVYGDCRFDLHDSRPEWRGHYQREMELPEDFAEGDRLPFTKEEQVRLHEQLIALAICEVQHYGFGTIFVLPGHGPNVARCQGAIELFDVWAERTPRLQPKADARMFFYITAAKESEPLLRKHWIHADRFEGSIVMAGAPETVRLDELPADPAVVPSAYLGLPYLDPRAGEAKDQAYREEHRELWENFDALDPRRGTSAEYGRRQVDFVLTRLREQVLSAWEASR